MKQSALTDNHINRSAKMAEFQGWSMPAQFIDPAEEYHAVRTAAGLFDVSFLGRIEVTGEGAETMLDKLFSRDLVDLSAGSALYGLFCTDNGNILDNSLVYKIASGKTNKRFLVTTNALSTAGMLAWFKQHAGSSVKVADITAKTAQFALQGPRSDAILHLAAPPTFKKPKQKRIRETTIADNRVIVARTGYTGERGFELFVDTAAAVTVWEALLAAGKEYGILPCGMTCREMLRIEAGYVQKGIDIDESGNPWEAGLDAIIDQHKEFAGKEALLAKKGGTRRLVGFELFGKGIPRPGGTIFSESREIGVVTSGCHSPHRRRDVGLGYVEARYAQAGLEIEVEFKDREITAKILDLPIYRRK